MRPKTTFPCTIMRGGTSKGIFLMEKDLPRDLELRSRIILTIFGSPDIRQIDGLGGANSLTSKLALISPSDKENCDIDYTFGAVGIDRAFVDYSANCGNISSAVGPYAISKGLVKTAEPFTIVKIYNTNTKKMILAKIPVWRRKVTTEGDYAIDGCPGTSAKIELSFMDPGGASTGKLLPTGNRVDEVRLDEGDRYSVTIVDAGNPTAFVRAEELNLRGHELPGEFDLDMATRTKLEAIRKKVGELTGIPVTPSIPKISFVAPSQDYKTVSGNTIRKESVSMLARVMAMGRMHKTFAITAGIPVAIAAVIPESVVNQVYAGGRPVPEDREIVIGHPSGMMEVRVSAQFEKGQPHIISCTVARTARMIMDGKVYVPPGVYLSKK